MAAPTRFPAWKARAGAAMLLASILWMAVVFQTDFIGEKLREVATAMCASNPKADCSRNQGGFVYLFPGVFFVW